MTGFLNKRTEGVAAGALEFDPVNYTLLAAFTAVAWCYAFELNLKIFLTFKRRRGLYFWSLLICSWGLSLHALAFILKFYVGNINWVFSCTIITIGWYAMVTGQAFVLYSRLHLVVRDVKILRGVLIMIIVNICVLHVPTTIFTFGSNSPNGKSWIPKFDVMERIQLAGFCLQEFIISTLYVWATLKLLKSIYHSMTRRVMAQLIIINLVCVGCDIILVGLEYTGKYITEASSKPFFYALKLKLEFAVLNQLMVLANTGLTEGARRTGGGGTSEGKSRSGSVNMLQSMDPPEGRRPSEIGTWSFAKGGRKESSSKPWKWGNHSPDARGISKTQHIEVSSEVDLGPTRRNNSDSPPLAGVYTDRPKANSLMGTTLVQSPSRAGGKSPLAGRKNSPSESEMEFITHEGMDPSKPEPARQGVINGSKTVQVPDQETIEAARPSIVRSGRNSIKDFGNGDPWNVNPYRKAKEDSDGPFHHV